MINKASLHTLRGVWIQRDDETVASFFERATKEDDVLIDHIEETLENDSWVEMERKAFQGAFND
jgi:hypothetical protein